MPDSGAIYGPKGAYTYGWSSSQMPYAMNLGAMDNFIQPQPPATWSFDVPNGHYSVTAGFGTSAGPVTVSGCEIEGRTLGLGVVAAGARKEVTVAVEVTDGQVTFTASAVAPCDGISDIVIKPQQKGGVAFECYDATDSAGLGWVSMGIMQQVCRGHCCRLSPTAPHPFCNRPPDFRNRTCHRG